MHIQSVEHVYGPLESHSGQSLPKERKKGFKDRQLFLKCLWVVQDGLHGLAAVGVG